LDVQYDLLALLSLKMRKGLMQVIEDNLAAPQGFEPRYLIQNYQWVADGKS